MGAHDWAPVSRPDSEWVVILDALRDAASTDGSVHVAWMNLRSALPDRITDQNKVG